MVTADHVHEYTVISLCKLIRANQVYEMTESKNILSRYEALTRLMARGMELLKLYKKAQCKVEKQREIGAFLINKMACVHQANLSAFS